MPGPADLIETTTLAPAGATRRLTTKEKVKTRLGVSGSTDDATFDEIIDQVSARLARWCRLSEDSLGNEPTFGQESLRATWMPSDRLRGSRLLLPWRRPVTAITSVVEAGVALSSGAAFRFVGRAGELVRFSSDREIRWSSEKIVVVMTAGWSLPAGVPPDIEAAVIDQVKLVYLGRDRDDALRSETVPDSYAAQYAVAGGDSIGSSGLLLKVEEAFEPHRNEIVP